MTTGDIEFVALFTLVVYPLIRALWTDDVEKSKRWYLHLIATCILILAFTVFKVAANLTSIDAIRVIIVTATPGGAR